MDSTCPLCSNRLALERELSSARATIEAKDVALAAMSRELDAALAALAARDAALAALRQTTAVQEPPVSDVASASGVAAAAFAESGSAARRLEYELDAAWFPYGDPVQRAVAAAEACDETRVRVKIGNIFYLLDLERLRQTNEVTGYARPIRWMEADASASDPVPTIAKAGPSTTTCGLIQCLVGTAGGGAEWVTYAADVQKRVASVAASGGSVITFTRDGTTYELNWTPHTMLQTNLDTGSTRPLRWADRSVHHHANAAAGAPPPPRPAECQPRPKR
jgi:hypothetical protein